VSGICRRARVHACARARIMGGIDRRRRRERERGREREREGERERARERERERGRGRERGQPVDRCEYFPGGLLLED